MVARPRPAGIQLFYRINPAAVDPLLGPIGNRLRFSFSLKQLLPDVFTRYEPDLTSETGPQLYLDNLTPAGNLQSKDTLTTGTVLQADDAAQILPPIFPARADLNVAAPPSQFRVLDRFDATTTVDAFPIDPSATGLASTKVDLSAEEPGPYTLSTDVGSPPPRTIYIDRDLARVRRLGVIDIHWETRQDSVPAGGLTYFIRLRKR